MTAPAAAEAFAIATAAPATADVKALASGASGDDAAQWTARGTWWVGLAPASAAPLDPARFGLRPWLAPLAMQPFRDDRSNLLANVMYRFQKRGRSWTPYVGATAVVPGPQLGIQGPLVASQGFADQQAALFALQAQAGLQFALTDRLLGVTEYRLNYEMNPLQAAETPSLLDGVTSAFSVRLSYQLK